VVELDRGDGMSRQFIAPHTGVMDIVPCAERRGIVTALLALACAPLVASLSAGTAAAGDKSIRNQLVGSWRFVSSLSIRKDGSTFDRWGPTARGIFIFDRNGYYSQMIANTDRMFGPRAVSSFGKFSVDEAAKIIITEIEGSSTPKAIGTTQRRTIISLNEDQLKYLNPSTPSGNTVEAVWERIK
jgi:lipocalin-like protein